MTLGFTIGVVPATFTITEKPFDSVDGVELNQSIINLSDSDPNSIPIYFYKSGSLGSQKWLKFCSHEELDGIKLFLENKIEYIKTLIDEDVSFIDEKTDSLSLEILSIKQDIQEIENSIGNLDFSYPVYALNTPYKISDTRNANLSFSVDIGTTISLSGSQTGKVTLEVADDSGFTSGVKTIQEFTNGNSGALVIGLTLNQLQTACLSGTIEKGKFFRIKTFNVAGEPNFTFKSAQRVLI